MRILLSLLISISLLYETGVQADIKCESQDASIQCDFTQPITSTPTLHYFSTSDATISDLEDNLSQDFIQESSQSSSTADEPPVAAMKETCFFFGYLSLHFYCSS